VTEAKLQAIEQAEDIVRSFGFRIVRVRHHGDVARLELAREELPRLLEAGVSDALDGQIRALGFRYVAVDLKGYRLGSLNEGLTLKVV
jgi:pyridinium-3,5-biscarboxylic acid mononucleotide sulfurtransferase